MIWRRKEKSWRTTIKLGYKNWKEERYLSVFLASNGALRRSSSDCPDLTGVVNQTPFLGNPGITMRWAQLDAIESSAPYEASLTAIS